MSDLSWQTRFREAFDRGVAAWNAGRRSPRTMFDSADAAFLASIGCTTQELFDFVDDLQLYGEPDFDTVMAIQAIRRDHFLNVMGGKSSGRAAATTDLPAKAAAVDGIAWLPRLIAKARLKLRGELPDDLMFGCGGDRAFLRRVRMSAPDFLRLVRDSGSDDRQVVETVKRAAAG